MAGRFGSRLVALVCPALDQLHVVVGERPEPGLGSFQCPGIVKAVEGLGGLVDQASQAQQHGPVQWVGDGLRIDSQRGSAVSSETQGEPAGVHDLDGQAPAVLHLAVVKCRVGTGAPVGRPVPHGV